MPLRLPHLAHFLKNKEGTLATLITAMMLSIMVK
jgi:hypothetical protein